MRRKKKVSALHPSGKAVHKLGRPNKKKKENICDVKSFFKRSRPIRVKNLRYKLTRSSGKVWFQNTGIYNVQLKSASNGSLSLPFDVVSSTRPWKNSLVRIRCMKPPSYDFGRSQDATSCSPALSAPKRGAWIGCRPTRYVVPVWVLSRNRRPGFSPHASVQRTHICFNRHINR